MRSTVAAQSSGGGIWVSGSGGEDSADNISDVGRDKALDMEGWQRISEVKVGASRCGGVDGVTVGGFGRKGCGKRWKQVIGGSKGRWGMAEDTCGEGRGHMKITGRIARKIEKRYVIWAR